MSTVIFLADCGPNVGLGHLRRLLVLATAFHRQGADCCFFLTDMRDAEFVQRVGFRVASWEEGGAALPSAAVVAIDGYNFDNALPVRWRLETGCTTLIIDDLAEKPVNADVVLNHNLYGDELDYSAYRNRLLLTGPRYALVDPAFATLASRERSGRHVLVSFGGTDDGRLGEAAARALLSRDASVIVDLVIASSAAEWANRTRLMEDYAGRCRIHLGAAMVERMAAATVYFGAAGVTVLEAIAAGLQVVVCGIVDNQRYNIRKLQELSVPAFDRFDLDQMTTTALNLLSASKVSHLLTIDGRGAERVVQAVLGLRHRGPENAVLTSVMPGALSWRTGSMSWRGCPITRSVCQSPLQRWRSGHP